MDNKKRLSKNMGKKKKKNMGFNFQTNVLSGLLLCLI